MSLSDEALYKKLALIQRNQEESNTSIRILLELGYRYGS